MLRRLDGKKTIIEPESVESDQYGTETSPRMNLLAVEPRGGNEEDGRVFVYRCY